MPKLNPNEYVPFAPDTSGTRRRINHSSDNCDGDSQSLSIWRNEDDSVGAKCYRCGATGRTGSKPSMFKKSPETKRLREVPKDISSQFEDMPAEAATYLNSKGISETIAFHYGVGWSQSANGLVFPVHNELHHDGCQVKFFEGKQRYTTIHNGRRELMFSHLEAGSYDIVIVEDLLSAIRIVESPIGKGMYDAFALLGSELNDQGLAQLLKYGENFIVWLDNDNDIVCNKAKKLYHRLSLFGKAQLVKDQCEPKDITDDQIVDIITARR